mgnify:CR=1 FL=1
MHLTVGRQKKKMKQEEEQKEEQQAAIARRRRRRRRRSSGGGSSTMSVRAFGRFHTDTPDINKKNTIHIKSNAFHYILYY